MLASHAANRETFTVTTPSDEEIRMTRRFGAPRALVFEALTRPEHIKRWWGNLGEGYSVPVCEFEQRVGAKWRFVNRHPNGEAGFHGEVRAIEPPSRLEFTEIFDDFPDVVSVVTTTLDEDGAGTRMTVTVRYPSKDVRDMVLGTGMAKGAAISYDRLDDLVIELSAGA